jgi:hypothetical protein
MKISPCRPDTALSCIAAYAFAMVPYGTAQPRLKQDTPLAVPMQTSCQQRHSLHFTGTVVA